VLVRSEEEGQVLLDEIGELRRLLPGMRDYLTSIDAGAEQRQRIDAAIDEAKGDDSRYRRLEMLAERLAGLREALYQALKILQTLRRERQEQPEYRAVRAAIRDYVVWQNEQERKLIAPAFYGRGPRR
jgi:Mg2+ and Co2+ transporter CorA